MTDEMDKKFPMTGNLTDELVYWEQNNGAPYHRAALDEIERLEDVLQQIATWYENYPRPVFDEPTKEQWLEAHNLLDKAGGCSLVAISASRRQHVLRGICKIINKEHPPKTDQVVTEEIVSSESKG